MYDKTIAMIATIVSCNKDNNFLFTIFTPITSKINLISMVTKGYHYNSHLLINNGFK